MEEELTDGDILKLGALCDELVDGVISAERYAELQRWLLTDEAVRRHYVRVMGLSASLHEYAGEFESEEGGEALVEFADLGVKRRWPWKARWSLAAALVASLFLGALLLTQMSDHDNQMVVVAQDDGVAVLTRASGLEWEEGAKKYRLGDRIAVGAVQIAAGTMQIEFYSGASVILEGPASLDIVSANEAFCHYGKVRGKVPPQAIGFTVKTADYDLVDLGTEFGISVDKKGSSEVHVFDGEVELRGVGRASETKGLTEGQAMRLNGAELGKDIVMDATLFPHSSLLDDVDGARAESRYQRWKDFSGELRKDASLMAYYTFEPQRAWDRVLPNQGSLKEPGLDGAIVGAKWARGRWPGKKALDFKSPADRVRLILPGEYKNLTYGAWVRIDGMDRLWVSLLLTDDWKLGSPHWQIEQTGEMILGVGTRGGNPNFYSKKEIGFEDLGRWMFLATVFDSEKLEVRHLIDGRVVSRAPIVDLEKRLPLKFGAMEMGNYHPPGVAGTKNVRNFNGRIDEFMLFNRALSDEELNEIFQVGRPDAVMQK
ncbi:MAG: FecR domain-containing protein [Verrucomicrobiales bacterium]|nr:FecR domain-containing protein [Verrucomicrobiales bacterium]